MIIWIFSVVLGRADTLIMLLLWAICHASLNITVVLLALTLCILKVLVQGSDLGLETGYWLSCMRYPVVFVSPARQMQRQDSHLSIYVVVVYKCCRGEIICKWRFNFNPSKTVVFKSQLLPKMEGLYIVVLNALLITVHWGWQHMKNWSCVQCINAGIEGLRSR